MKSIRVGVAPRMITLHSLSSWSWIPINLPLLARGASDHHFHQPKRLRSSRAAVSSLAKGSDFEKGNPTRKQWTPPQGRLRFAIHSSDLGWFLCGWPGCNLFRNYLFAHQKNVMAIKSSTRIFKTLPPCNFSEAPHPPCLS